MFLPHLHKVFRTDDECFREVVILKYLREGCGHQGLSQTDDVADQHSSSLVQMVGGNFDCGNLIVKKAVAKFRRDAEFGEACTRFLSQMVGHLHIDLIGWWRFFSGPAFVNDLYQFRGDVYAPMVCPSIVK